MKSRQRILIVALEAAIVLTIIYFEPSHCVRGTLWGEAFYDGRPTSWWRERIDRWMQQFDRPDQAAVMIDWSDAIVADQVLIWEIGGAKRAPTFMERVREWAKWSKAADDDWMVPKVLTGGAEAEPVLRALQMEGRYTPLADRALSKQKSNGPTILRAKNWQMSIIMETKKEP